MVSGVMGTHGYKKGRAPLPGALLGLLCATLFRGLHRRRGLSMKKTLLASILT